MVRPPLILYHMRLSPSQGIGSLAQKEVSHFNNSYALYKRLWTYLRQYWRIFTISLIAMVIAALTDTGFAWLMKPLINGGFIAHDPFFMVAIPFAIVGLFVARGVFTFINDYSSSWLAGHLVATMREQLFHRLLRLPVGYYDDHGSGRLMSRISNDVSQVTEAGFNVITVLVRDGVTILGLLGLLFYHDWQLTLVCVMVLPLLAISLRLVGKRLRKLAHVNQAQMGELTQVLDESIACQKVVKIYGGQAYEEKRLAKAAHAIRHNQVKQTAVSSLSGSIAQLVVALALAVIIYFASLRAIYGFTAGDFVSFLVAMCMLFAPIKRMLGVHQSLQRGLAAAESVFGFLDEKPESDEGTKVLQQVRGELCFEQMNFRYLYSEKFVLSDINFTVRAGETIALVGSSGSGKTTLVNLIPRFYDPTNGRVLIDGLDVQQYSLSSLRSQIALVSQDVVLFNDTVAANIAYGEQALKTREEIVWAALAANAMEFIQDMPQGLDTLIGENGVRLSGGQRQRLAIARALLKNSPILILDEATSALDNQSERLVQEALDRLMENRTTIVIAHRLSTVEHADRILVMQEGRIVEEGVHQVLLDKGGVYAKLYALQFRVT